MFAKCVWCAESFSTSRRDSKYCSAACRQKAHKGFLCCEGCALPATKLILFENRRYCTRCAFDAEVDIERRDLAALIDWCNTHAVCIYCGDGEEHREHVIPRHAGLATFVVASCAECNLIVGGRVFSTILEKQDHIRSRIARRYKKLLAMPEWTDEEIADLKARLREYVTGCSTTAKWIRARMDWDIREMAKTASDIG